MRKLLHSLHPAMLIPLLLALLLPVTAIAHDFEVDGIYYNIVNGEAVVTFQGTSYYSTAYSGDVVIPETVYYNGTTYSVTAIGEYAFRYCSGLTSASIPNSVTTIGANAFQRCSGLTNVSIPNSVTSIGRNAFNSCTNLSNIQMSNSVTDIGYSAFDNTSWYNNQQDGLVYIGLVLYQYKGTMPAGTSITIKDGTLGIAGEAFYNCSGMTSVNIPNTVVTISKWAFDQCTGLTSVTIPNSVITIDDYAFYSCSSLSSATIGNSVSFIGNYAFWGCPLTDISVVNGNTHYDSRGNCNAIIETASNTLIVGCQNTVIPNSVTAIGNNAFLSCTGLTNITIPNSVTTIGERAFGACSELSNITIPSSVTTIGERAFYGCSGLSNIAVASGNPIYDSRDNCNGIIETASNTLICGCQSTEIPNSVIAIGDYAFYYCTELTSLTLPNSVTTIGNYAFYQCSRLTNLTLPNSLIAIGNYAFNQCTGLTSINIPNAVTSIGNYAFAYSSGLTSLTLSNSLTFIGNYAFYNCTGLTNINIPNHVTTIGERAFMGCTGLTSLTLPSSLNTIGNYAFAGCETLNDVYSFIYYFNNDDYFSMGYEVFARGGDYSNRTLHVPRSNSGNYQQDSRWSQYFGNIVEMPSRFEVDGIYYSLINANEVAVTYDYNHKYTGNVNIPETINYEGRTYTVTAIGDEAFESCINLTSVTIPNSVTSIGTAAFRGCTKLANINIPNSVTSIGNDAFRNCIKLADVNIPNSVTSIGKKAFAYCYRLTEITVPESVTTISLTTFSYCYSLTQVTWNARNCMLEYTYFDDEDHLPFAYCPSLKKIIIGSEVESIDDEIFCIYDPVYNNIDTVMCLAEVPPVISEDCFWFHTYEKATLCVPRASVDSYASATGWKEFVNRATIATDEDYPGDVDNDGTVTIGDVTLLIDYILGTNNHSINSVNADVDGDRYITIGDVTALIDDLLRKN